MSEIGTSINAAENNENPESHPCLAVKQSNHASINNRVPAIAAVKITQPDLRNPKKAVRPREIIKLMSNPLQAKFQ